MGYPPVVGSLNPPVCPMLPPMIVFAHGLEGNPNGAKITAMRAAGLHVEAPDCRMMVLAERVALLDSLTRRLSAHHGPLLLGGSSYGGVAVAHLAAQHPERFGALFLCAPALMVAEPPVHDPDALVVPEGMPAILIHGIGDPVVTIEVSRSYVARSHDDVELIEVDDGHKLSGSLDLVVESVRRLQRRAGLT